MGKIWERTQNFETPLKSHRINDLNGNAVTRNDSSGITTYTWDFENRLTSVLLPGSGGTVSFKYDPFGRRIYKSSSSGTQTQYVDEPLAMLRSGTTSYFETDGLGSTTSLSNASGALAQTYTFDSFGKTTNSSGSPTNPFQYTSRELDSETRSHLINS